MLGTSTIFSNYYHIHNEVREILRFYYSLQTLTCKFPSLSSFLPSMNANKTTPVESKEANGNLLPEEEDLSSGNSRLAMIVGALLALVIAGYIMLPAQASRQIVNAMPGIELGDATVTASRLPAESASAAETPTDEAEDADEPEETPRLAVHPATAATPAAPVTASVATSEIEIEPVPAAAPAAEATPENVTYSGRILDEDGRPLAGATVMVKGSRKATGTDANGNYTLEAPAGDNTLVYGYGGYQDHEVRPHGTQPLTVTLLPSENMGRRRRK